MELCDSSREGHQAQASQTQWQAVQREGPVLIKLPSGGFWLGQNVHDKLIHTEI